MPNPNRPENANSIAPGATVAMPMDASIQHEGVTTRYIDTNTGRRAAFDQWLGADTTGTVDADLGLRIRLIAIAPTPIAAQIHNAEWYDTAVPSPTTVPAQANPIEPPMPYAALLSPGSDPGSSSGACMTPSADIGVSATPMAAPNTMKSRMAIFRSSAKTASSAVTTTAKTSPARNTVTQPIRTASRPINGDTISWTSAAGVMNSNAVISPLALKPTDRFSAIDGMTKLSTTMNEAKDKIVTAITGHA